MFRYTSAAVIAGCALLPLFAGVAQARPESPASTLITAVAPVPADAVSATPGGSDFKTGYRDGYRQGHTDGLQDAKTLCKQRVQKNATANDEYDQGFAAGYNSGYPVGFALGAHHCHTQS